MNKFRRTILCTLAIACSGLGISQSANAASDYPNKSVRWVVPFAPGAANDIIARIVATGLSNELGQSFVVDNRAGAGGLVGALTVASAAADGYTLLLSNPGPNVSNPILMKDAPYKIKSFDSVIVFGYVPLVIVAHPSFPANNSQELLAYLKANPGKINWGSSGNLSNPHIALELFRMVTGAQMIHIPYKGSGPALNDVIAGQIQVLHTSLASVDAHIKSGRLKAIAVANATRLPQLPNVSTLSEAGINGADSFTWFGMSVPASTPKDVVAKLNTAANKVMKAPEARTRLEGIGLNLLGGTPQTLDRLIVEGADGLKKLVASGALNTK